jgi:oxygen-independent coproporphyrinogen-3 oxidase
VKQGGKIFAMTEQGVPPPTPPPLRKLHGGVNSGTDKSVPYSFDLIYGLPYQRIEDVAYSLKEMLKLQPQHISIYCLSLEEGVPLYKLKDKIPSDEVVSDMYFMIKETLESEGFIHYELSSFCKDGKVSLHNMSYWSGVYYLGLGAGAHGYVDGQRYYNIPHKDTREDTKPQRHREIIYLTKEDIEKEYIITGLRKTAGIALEDFYRRFGYDLRDKYRGIIDRLLFGGYIKVDSHLRIQPEYYFVSNEILQEFV